MKKIIIPAVCALALMLANCKKEDKSPAPAEDPTPKTEDTPTNPSATGNNGIAIAAMTFGGSVSNGKMVKVDLDSKTTTDLPIPFCLDDYFDVSPDGKKVAYMRQYSDTLAYVYSLETGSKTALLVKSGTFDFPAGIHYNKDGSKLMFFIKGKIYSLDPNGTASQTPVLISTMDSGDGPGTPFTWNADATKFIANGFSGRTNTEAHNLCYVDVASGKVTRVSNGIADAGEGFGKEVTQAQHANAPAFKEIIAQNGMYGNATYGYRGWTLDGNIYYYSNKNVYQMPGQSPQGTVTPLLFNLASPAKTEDAAAYTGTRILTISGDGKKYIALNAMLNAKLKVFNKSDNSEIADLSSIQNSAQWVAGIRFANK